MKVIEELHKYICNAGSYNSNSELAPKVILWPDGERLFERCIPVLLKEIPELLVLGIYNPENRTGPAIWLRCAVAKTIEINLPADRIPIIYLPGISRDDLHVEKKVDEIKPLIPLQYMGKFFSQRSSKDITPLAIFSGKEYLGLNVVDGNKTRDALRAAIDIALTVDVNSLTGIALDDAFFNKLITGGDPITEVLSYLDCETDFFAGMNDVKKQAIISTFINQFKFNPTTEGRFRAAELLAKHDTIEWKPVWDHYQLSYTRFINIENAIRKCTSYETPLFGGKEYEGWPQFNQEAEERLFNELKSLQNKPKIDVYKSIDSLFEEHKERLDFVWTKKGQSPLLLSLDNFKKMIDLIRNNSFGASLEDLSKFYQEIGYQVDDYMLQTLAHINNDDYRTVLQNLLKQVYSESYLDVLAKNFQNAAKDDKYPYKEIIQKYEKDTCLLFADGLRFDLAKSVSVALAKLYKVIETPFWVPFPTITQCGKYSVSPVIKDLSGSEPGDFSPHIKQTEVVVTNTNFKSMLEEKGWQYIENASIKEKEYGWYPFSNIDSLGHKLGEKLPMELDNQISSIVNAVKELKNAGWKTVKIVTDHGWLFVPGNMPKCEKSGNMIDSHKDRYSLVQAGQNSGYPQVAWSWNQNYQVGTPTGIGSFVDGKVYTHGGLSLQECLTLQLTVIDDSDDIQKNPLSISNIKWKGMSCSFDIIGNISDITACIRTSPADKNSLISSEKKPEEDGHTRLLVTEDDLDGKKAYIVLIDSNENLVMQKEVIVGEN